MKGFSDSGEKKGVLHRLGSMSLTKKFIWSYFFLVFIPLVGMVTIISSLTLNSLKEKTLNIVEQNLAQSADYCSYLFQEIENTCIGIRSEWGRIDFDQENEVYRRYLFDKALESLDDRLYLYGIYDSMILFVEDTSLIPQVSNKFYDLSLIKGKPIYEWVQDSPTRGVWTSSHQLGFEEANHRIVYCVMMEEPFEDDGQRGLMVLYFMDEEFSRILDTIAIRGSDYAYIVDKENNLLLASSGYRQESVDKEEQVIQMREDIGESGLSIIYRTDQTGMFEEIKEQQHMLYIITGLFFFVAMAISVVIAGRMTKGIQHLIVDMKRTVNKMTANEPIVFEAIDSRSQNEITRLNLHYQKMVLDIKQAHDQNLQAESARREAELRALQMQINPHFLYNILDSINWLSLKYKAQDISDIVTGLGNFYRFTLSGGKDIISLEEELKLIQVYIEIQQVRFKNSIHVTYDLDESMMTQPICKMTLQPLVENGIYHGIMSKKSKQGHLKISTVSKEGFYYIDIKDDGGMMNPDLMNQTLREGKERDRSKHGYGIYNVQERLQLYFGLEAQLEFFVEGGWSVSRVRLPK